MANEPSREECVNNLRHHINGPEILSKTHFTTMVNGEFAIGTDKAKLILKYKGREFLFQKQGDPHEADMILTDWCEFLRTQMPGIEMVDLEEIPKAMLHPGQLDEEGYAAINVKGWVNNKPYVIFSRITKIMDLRKDKQ